MLNMDIQVEKINAVKETEKVQPLFPCAFCSMKFFKVKDCYDHVRTHVEVKYDGKIKTFGKRNNLEVYDKNCNADNKTSIEPNSKNPHKKDCEKLYTCEVCHKKFADKKYFQKKHLLSHLVPCQLCSKAFQTIEEVIEHQNIHADGKLVEPKKYQCKFCESSFGNNSKLLIHMRKHTGEKPYSCDFCQKAFSNNQVFRRHSCVKKEPKWTCKQCPSTFYTQYQLVKHASAHGANKVFRCDGCGKELASKSSLLRHCKFSCESVKQTEHTFNNNVLQNSHTLVCIKSVFCQTE